jgi:predicted adenine nucleotide alpha hydrolase (AANH) superfamily ATPase
MKKLLLHTCCGPCSTHVIETLKHDYEVTLFFYNPNLYPKEEFERRLAAAQKVSEMTHTPIIVGEYNTSAWNDAIRGYEHEPEGGRRCIVCMGMRLHHTAEYAKTLKYDIFASTLSISPHKNSKMINEQGFQVAEGVSFLAEDFKKNEGFSKSIKISRDFGLYRQNYCGCIYSLNKSIASPKE